MRLAAAATGLTRPFVLHIIREYMSCLRVFSVTVFITAIVTAFPRPAGAQSPNGRAPARSFRATVLPDTDELPVVDGRVSEAVWQRVEPLTGFTQQDPRQGEPATEPTEVRLLFTPTHVYVGVICFDRDPSSIIRTQSKRDGSLAETDSIVFVLDTFNDNQNAFVFGTNPIGIEYDGQVAREGQSSGVPIGGGFTLAQTVAAGSQRGSISAFNPNWDGDWTVRAQVTERGWEAEIAIPFKTLRYAPGADRTWGFNVLRNIRHKNEQVYLAPIPRGFDIYRVSEAAKITGIRLPPRRDVKLIPYGLAAASKDFTRAADQTDGRGTGGLDLKWGVRPSLTLDATVNTDFAQVEADEQQLNLTRFDLFFPEKRPFFLENASTFQVGQPQQADLFFSRRIGLSPAGAPIDILAGTRLSGKLGRGWNVGLLNVQTDSLEDAAGRRLAPETNFSVIRVQREVGRSTFGGIFVGKYATGDRVAGLNPWNRTYGVDADIQVSRGQRISTFLARTDTPGATGSDYAGRAVYTFTNTLWQVAGGISQIGDRFNPEVGFLPRRGYWRPETRVQFNYQPKSIAWIRRTSPHASAQVYRNLDGTLQSSSMHIHPFEIQPAAGGRFGWFMDRNQDQPTRPFTVYNRDGRTVTIAPGLYTWWQHGFEYLHNPSAPVTVNGRLRIGRYYDGEFRQVELTNEYRLGARLIASVGWTRQRAELSAGTFVTNLVPVKAVYSFTPHASVSALLQYNGQTAQFSSNVRLALLNRSGTGLFVVYNDQRDVTGYTAIETIGRSFTVKFTRLMDF